MMIDGFRYSNTSSKVVWFAAETNPNQIPFSKILGEAFGAMSSFPSQHLQASSTSRREGQSGSGWKAGLDSGVLQKSTISNTTLDGVIPVKEGAEGGGGSGGSMHLTAPSLKGPHGSAREPGVGIGWQKNRWRGEVR